MMCRKRANIDMGRANPNKKSSSFSVGYKSLFTMFPQMWISEIKLKRGEKL
jgi:hypothetical protein